MSDSIRDLAATIARLKDQAGRLRAAVVADKGAADGLVQRFRAVGVEGGPAARLSGCAAGHERAVSQLEAIEARLERARFIAMSAINGLHGSGTVARSGDQADDPTSWEKPTTGTELVEEGRGSRRRRRGRAADAFRSAVRQADDVQDVAKQTVGQGVEVAKSFTKLPDPPTQTTATVQARTPQAPAFADTSSAKATDLIGGLTLTAVAVLTGIQHAVEKRRSRKRQDD
ncbi:hypothetical protein FB566_2970 [Stackebrandtia endophytica]|uniref:Uncharacterized protein n=1 Tax=Stackebrandtia endophytica TaxID=1496996 RepID=A0A543AXV5_9ACTN|nr:hypothetical protein [Stackebrandtia endophytica]TQL77411.1 hypothetical protein FB566_2970 [Stackebrandtia endophytica]